MTARIPPWMPLLLAGAGCFILVAGDIAHDSSGAELVVFARETRPGTWRTETPSDASERVPERGIRWSDDAVVFESGAELRFAARHSLAPGDATASLPAGITSLTVSWGGTMADPFRLLPTDPFWAEGSRGFTVELGLDASVRQVAPEALRAVCAFLESAGVQNVCCGCWTNRTLWLRRLDVTRGSLALGEGSGNRIFMAFCACSGVPPFRTLAPLAGSEPFAGAVLGSESEAEGVFELQDVRSCLAGGRWVSLGGSLRFLGSRMEMSERLQAAIVDRESPLAISQTCLGSRHRLFAATPATDGSSGKVMLTGHRSANPITLGPLCRAADVNLTLSFKTSAGFHPAFRISWSPSLASSANLTRILLALRLTNTAFADPYEVQWRSAPGIAYVPWGSPDLEAPAQSPAARANGASVLVDAARGWADVPFHLRYQAPADGPEPGGERPCGRARVEVPAAYGVLDDGIGCFAPAAETNGGPWPQEKVEWVREGSRDGLFLSDPAGIWARPPLPGRKLVGLAYTAIDVPPAMLADGTVEFRVPIGGPPEEARLVRLATWANVVLGALVVIVAVLRAPMPRPISEGKDD
ncbi:hypothetical protein DFJ74DRAFT_768227 [Hyaloraphidium curvatum]|nr:hypothetical protein DFJ74DRAFT_768227 [Hyaloraphidium curvatum]